MWWRLFYIGNVNQRTLSAKVPTKNFIFVQTSEKLNAEARVDDVGKKELRMTFAVAATLIIVTVLV